MSNQIVEEWVSRVNDEEWNKLRPANFGPTFLGFRTFTTERKLNELGDYEIVRVLYNTHFPCSLFEWRIGCGTRSENE